MNAPASPAQEPRTRDNPPRKRLSAPRTAKLSMHPRALLDRASCLELDWFDRAYRWRAPLSGLLAFPFAVILCGTFLAASLMLLSWPIEQLLGLCGVAPESAEMLSVHGLGLLAVPWLYWLAWRGWADRTPAPNERAAREACWELLVQLLGRCAPHTPKHARATLELERVGRASWAWRLSVPVAPYTPNAVAVFDARGDDGTRYTCTLTQASGARVVSEATRADTDAPWTLNGLPTHTPAATLAEHLCATLYSETARATERPLRAVLGAASAALHPDTLGARGVWALRARRSGAQLPLTQPSRGRWAAELGLKLTYLLVGAASCLGVHAFAAQKLWDQWSLGAYPDDIMLLAVVLMGPLFLVLLGWSKPVLSGWSEGLHLVPRLHPRRVREAPAAAADAALQLRGGVLSLGDARIELERPFQVDLTQEPTSAKTQPRLGVVLTQGQGAQSERLGFACEAAVSPELSALPKLASSAPMIASDDLVDALWPALAAYASAHGEQLLGLRLEVEG